MTNLGLILIIVPCLVFLGFALGMVVHIAIMEQSYKDFKFWIFIILLIMLIAGLTILIMEDWNGSVCLFTD